MKILQLLISLLLVSCAQQTILTGGAKDNKPPKLVLDSNRIVTNFSENHLLLEFNENIQLIKDKRTFITNPEINNIELIEEKNKIDLVWIDSLSKNTTYSFIFINAIADITESNKIDELKYIISTGNKIDSGSIYGSINKYPEKSPLENALVYAKGINGNSNFHRTYSNSNGEYILNNLKKGKYILYCFDDENNNYLLDTVTEVHGFYLDTIIINDTIVNKDIIAYKPYEKVALDEVKFNTLGHLELNFNRPIDSCSVQDLESNYIYSSNSLNNKHHFYFKDTIEKHTIIIKSKNEFYDTVRIAYDYKKPYENKIIYKEYINHQLESPREYKLAFNQYINRIDTSLIEILSDSNKIPTQFYFKKNILSVVTKKELSNYKMTLFPKSVIGVKNIKKDTSFVAFKINNKRNLSSLELKVNNIPFNNAIIQIFKSEIMVKEISINEYNLDTTFNNCLPGKYYLKLIGDSNKDGYWTIGNFKNKVLPEPIIDYEGEVELKKNWTANILWDFKIEK